ncbi:Uncharacterized membrane-anchored protein [Lutimaribacter pacificus]|uniref:Uncharacterized membrane-anchored protein n=1 Tax=Lutimaribacter pacificus TaxID=391948 RepID=A0A1H0B462_9RHOB|nr:DUF3422 domain-containing protein [Lutimaribacter pacificus]SDN40454.1 Uncharacterized membrane-anchored protein [Lutimaribacter pacificus]SHJ60660.1 Uncharacterized membrane-anchored protein [Lutimaribacter pacificus]
MAPIADHPLRYQLANELHARPFPSIPTPSTAVYLAVKQPEGAAGRDRAADMAHLLALLDRYGAPHPQPGATHYSGRLGRFQLKWESHTEFVTYTAFIDGLSSRPFDPADFEVFPPDWLDRVPGVRMTSALIRVGTWNDKDKVSGALNDWFVPESLAVSRVLDDAAVIAGDFRIDAAGHQRFAVFVAPGTGDRRVGRMVQRLCEIETYKTMSMLGFSEVKAMSPRMTDIDDRLTDLMDEMTDNATPAEDTLGKLLQVSAELETMAARASFRFGATGAYEAIVHQRIEVLREQRFDGRQTFSEFMMRRYDPAMRTVKSAQGRLAAMSERAIRAGDLLRTRVDVERSAQNQALLESMNTRADMQLKLQRTVEGLSVVAISYYAVSLAGYALYPLAGVLDLSKGSLIAAITLPVVLLVWWLIRRLQRSLH